jgi:hypothetical protein
MKACFGVVKYRLGSKPKLGTMPGVYFKTSDCSGFVGWLLYGASHGKVTLRTGSWYQRKWCDDEGFKKVKYSEVAKLKDSRLRIAFIRPESGKIGHVWLVINGQTIECYGGHGVGRRPWDTKVLMDNVSDCYVLTDKI